MRIEKGMRERNEEEERMKENYKERGRNEGKHILAWVDQSWNLFLLTLVRKTIAGFTKSCDMKEN